MGVHAVAPRRALPLAPKPPPWSWQLALPLYLVCLSGRVLRPSVPVPCLTTSPSRHPGQRGQARDGLHPRRLIHGGHGEHDRRQHPGQLRERDRHHPQLPRRSARYELPAVGGAGQGDNPRVCRGSRGWRGVLGPGGCSVGTAPAFRPGSPAGATWQSPQHTRSQPSLGPGTGPPPGSFTPTGSTESKYWFVVK